MYGLWNYCRAGNSVREIPRLFKFNDSGFYGVVMREKLTIRAHTLEYFEGLRKLRALRVDKASIPPARRTAQRIVASWNFESVRSIWTYADKRYLEHFH